MASDLGRSGVADEELDATGAGELLSGKASDRPEKVSVIFFSKPWGGSTEVKAELL